jgi:hypothetical protein
VWPSGREGKGIAAAICPILGKKAGINPAFCTIG